MISKDISDIERELAAAGHPVEWGNRERPPRRELSGSEWWVKVDVFEVVLTAGSHETMEEDVARWMVDAADG